MIVALSAVAALCTAQSPRPLELDRDHALEYVRQLAYTEGLGSDYQLDWITGRWSMAFTLPNHDRLQVDVTAGGEIQRMFLVDKHVTAPNIGRPMDNPNVVAQAWKLLKPMEPKGTLKLDDIEYGSAGFCAEFSVRVNGHRFFNLNPTYGYRLWFDPTTGGLVMYSNAVQPGSVNAATPRVTEATATLRLTQLCRDIGAGYFDPKSSIPVEIETELGYYKFAKEPTARLVWRLHTILFPDGRRLEGGSTSHFIDALSGEMIKSDDPGMGGIDVGEPRPHKGP